MFYILVFLLASISFAQDRCLDLFALPGPTFEINKLIYQNKPQEAIWLLRKNGLHERANVLQKELIYRLQKELLTQEFIELDGGSTELWVYRTESGLLAVWKPNFDEDAEINSGRNERLYFLVDQKFSLNLVPTTVSRRVNGRLGSLQYFVGDAKNGFSRRTRSIPPEAFFIDFLMAYDDGVVGRFVDKRANYLVLPSGQFALIDNARILMSIEDDVTADTPIIWKSIFTEQIQRRGLRLSEVRPGAEFVSRLRQISQEDLADFLKNRIPREEVERIIYRYNYYRRRFQIEQN